MILRRLSSKNIQRNFSNTADADAHRKLHCEAKAGDAEAQHDLGMLLLENDQSIRYLNNPMRTEAMHWLFEAAAQGNGEDAAAFALWSEFGVQPTGYPSSHAS